MIFLGNFSPLSGSSHIISRRHTPRRVGISLRIVNFYTLVPSVFTPEFNDTYSETAV